MNLRAHLRILFIHYSKNFFPTRTLYLCRDILATKVGTDCSAGRRPVFRDNVHAVLLPYVRKAYCGPTNLPARHQIWNGELRMGKIQKPGERMEIQ